MAEAAKLGEGRKAELQQKLRLALERYENVFGEPLPLKEVRAFLAETAERERREYLKERMGANFSRSDAQYLLEFYDARLKEMTAEKEVEKELDGIADLGEAADDPFLTAETPKVKDEQEVAKRKPGRPRNAA